MADKYKPYYLKVEPTTEEGRALFAGSLVQLEHREYGFGFFSKHFLSHTENPWAVIRFDSFSRDVGFSNEYATKDLALEGALDYLKRNGLSAVEFDLEAMIDSIKPK